MVFMVMCDIVERDDDVVLDIVDGEDDLDGDCCW